MRTLTSHLKRWRSAVLVVVVSLAASFCLVYQHTASAFTSATSNNANQFNAGTVALTNSQNGTAMFSLGNNGYLKPGQSGSFCLEVDYTGNVPSTNITLTATGYTNGGNVFGTYPLGPKVGLTIVQSNNGTAVKADCDANNATWTGAITTIFNAGTVSSFSASGATLSPAWAPTTTDHRVFNFIWTLDPTIDNNYQDATTDIGFVWTSTS